MTKETLEKMPIPVRQELERLRQSCKSDQKKFEIMRAAGYVKGLRDAGLITERQRQILFIYTSV